MVYLTIFIAFFIYIHTHTHTYLYVILTFICIIFIASIIYYIIGI